MKTNIKLLNLIADLGKATNLTLGGGSDGAETKNRPFGSGGGHYHNEKSTTNSHIAYIVEIGKAASLTLGAGAGGVETQHRPFGLSIS